MRLRVAIAVCLLLVACKEEKDQELARAVTPPAAPAVTKRATCEGFAQQMCENFHWCQFQSAPPELLCSHIKQKACKNESQDVAVLLSRDELTACKHAIMCTGASCIEDIHPGLVETVKEFIAKNGRPLPDVPQVQRPRLPPEAQSALQPTPKKIDFGRLFRQDQAGVVKMLGTPGRDELGEEQYDFTDLYVKVEYREGKAAGAYIASKTKTTSELLEWVGKQKQAHIDFDPPEHQMESFGFVWVHSKRLPADRLDARKILAASKPDVQRYLGEENSVLGWRRDGYVVTVQYDPDGVVRYLSIGFDPGLRPSEDPAAFRKWSNVPRAGECITVRGKNYMVHMDTGSITFVGRFLCP